MEKTSFIIQDLTIHNMPGLPRGLPTYKELAPHINIIYGSNGCGKTSTARAIRQLLWRHQPGAIQTEASITIGNDHWDIKLDGATSVIQRNGINEPLIGLPTAEESERYQLALHELIKNDDQELARVIIRESVGGYDPEIAGKELGYATGAKPKSTREFRDYDVASKSFDQFKKEHEALKRQEEKLDPLNKEKGQAEAARELKSWYEKLSSYLDTEAKLNQARATLADFPDILQHMTGEEFSNLEDLEHQLGNFARSIQNTQENINEQQSVIEGLNLPDGGLSPTVADEIEDRIGLMENAERDLRQCRETLQEAIAKEQEEIEQIGQGRNMDGWKGLSAPDINRLDEFLQKAHLTLSEKQAIESLIEILINETPDGTIPSADQLNVAIRALSYWLQEHQDSGLLPRRWLWILTSMGIGTAICVYVFGRYGFIGLPVIIACAFFARNKKSAESFRQNEYNSTGLEQPLSWNREEVIKKMEALIVQIRQSGWQEKILTKIEVYQKELENLGPRLLELERERTTLEEQLKSIPDTPDKDLKGFDAMFWFLKHVGQWHDSHTHVLQLQARIDQIEKDIKFNLERINELLTGSNAERVTDTPSAKAIFRRLKQLGKAWQDATTAIEQGKILLRQNQQQKLELETKMKLIYTKLNIENGEKEQVRTLVVQLQPYKLAKEDEQAETRIFSEKEQELKKHSLYDQLTPEIEQLNPGSVEQKIKELGARVDRLEQINKDITEIETNIKIIKAGNTLEEAYFKKEEALDGLSEMFYANLSAITGKLLVDRLKKLSGDENRPPVFRRAIEIFSRITNGRYKLIIQEGDTPSFNAYDTVLQKGQQLSELSTGTRIQLLLAVRLGFIEMLETTYRLPVLADELLASSDDNRSKAIIEALTEISRQGRQVFYFTAQKQEVHKWMVSLDNNSGISYKIFELDGRSNEASNYSDNGYDTTTLEFFSEIPESNGKTHTEYGKLLQIDRFNLLTETPAALHLWYLIEDTKVLTELLRIGLSKWGQLKTFIEYEGRLPIGDESLINRMKAKTEFLQRYMDLYRQGRPIPIDRAVLEQSEVVSSRFMDAITDKLNELNGNPQALMQALRNREVARFGSANIDQLEEFLMEEGYISNQDIISHEDIAIRMSAFLTHTPLNSHEVEQFISRVFKYDN